MCNSIICHALQTQGANDTFCFNMTKYPVRISQNNKLYCLNTLTRLILASYTYGCHTIRLLCVVILVKIGKLFDLRRQSSSLLLGYRFLQPRPVCRSCYTLTLFQNALSSQAYCTMLISQFCLTHVMLSPNNLSCCHVNYVNL